MGHKFLGKGKNIYHSGARSNNKLMNQFSMVIEFPFECFKVIFINNGLFDILGILFATTLFILVFY